MALNVANNSSSILNHGLRNSLLDGINSLELDAIVGRRISGLVKVVVACGEPDLGPSLPLTEIFE